MFVINTPNAVEHEAAMSILAQHEVHVEILFVGKKAILVISEQMPAMPCTFEDLENAVTNLNLCECHFQVNFLQEAGHLCHVCRSKIERTGEGEATCGHLTFTRSIR